jgi:hypothetical protein
MKNVKTNKIVFFSSMSIILILIVLLPILINSSWPINDQAHFAIYLTAKIFFGLSFVAAVIYSLRKETNATGITFWLIAITGIFQFLPLGLRALAQNAKSGNIWPSVILLLGALIEIALVGGFLVMNRRMVESNKAAEGKSDEIKPER